MELPDAIQFPPVEWADEDGLLAMGGDLTSQTLLLAYQQGIFPWYNGDQPILWWCPDPRCVLFPEEMHVSRSMEKIFRNNKFVFTVNKAFKEVIKQCSVVPREGQDGTWITPEMDAAYNHLYELGFAHSAEAWQDGLLVGGIYGVLIGKVFFGESMFSKRSNASKFAFLRFVKELHEEGVELVDCQVHSAHLQSLGARMIRRAEFVKLLEKLVTA